MLSASPSSTNVCDLQRSLVIIYGVDHGELDHGSDTPVCIQLARILRDRIKSGELPERRRIPSENDLVQAYGIARDTTRKAVAWLRDRGWVYTVPQRGTFVSPRKDWQSVDGENA